jgi:hypothetical protein
MYTLDGRPSPLRRTRDGVPNVTGQPPLISCQVPASSASILALRLNQREKNSGISKLRLISFEPVLRRTIESDTEMLTKCFNLGVLEPSKYTALAYLGSRLCLSLIQDQLETEQPT